MDKIVFFVIGSKKYFKYCNCNYELNGTNLAFVKDTLKYPFKMEFYNYNKKLIKLILSMLSIKKVVAEIQLLSENNSYEITLYKSQFQKDLLNVKKH